MEMKTVPITRIAASAEQLHAWEVDALKQQCSICKLSRPKTPTKDCDIKIKLTVTDSDVAWKHKHLFLHTDGHCKMFKPKA